MPPDYSSDSEKYIRVFDSVASRRDLSFSEKLLLALIAGLAARKGYCEASNPYLAERLGTEVTYLRKIIATLKEKGLIEVEVDQSRGNERRIRARSPLPPQGRPYDPMGAYPMPPGGHSPGPDYAPIGSDPPPARGHSYDRPGSEAMPAGGHHILKKNQSKTKEETKDHTPQGGQTKESQPSVPPEEMKAKPKAEAPERPKRTTVSLSRSEETHRLAWDALDYQAKRPFLDAAAAELQASGLSDPPARAVEPRAFHLYARASALAFIEQQREQERQAP